MELIKARYQVKCEMGGCRNVSDYTVKTARVGIRAHLHICAGCLRGLYGLIGKEIVPRPIENAIGGRRKIINDK